MKKAKIFLTALTVLAVAGGALAFKAKQQSIYAKCNQANHVCELSTILTKFLTTEPNQGTEFSYNLLGSSCIETKAGQPWVCTTRTVANPNE